MDDPDNPNISNRKRGRPKSVAARRAGVTTAEIKQRGTDNSTEASLSNASAFQNTQGGDRGAEGKKPKSAKPRVVRRRSATALAGEEGEEGVRGTLATVGEESGKDTVVPAFTESEVRDVFGVVPDAWQLNALRADPEDGMEESVRRQRKLVRRLRLMVPILRRIIHMLEEELACTDKLIVHRIKTIEKSLERLRKAQSDIENGVHEKAFEDTVKRYVVAHAARVEEEDLLRGAAKRQHILPTVGLGYGLLDSDCSRETRPPVTVEERLGRMSRGGVSKRLNVNTLCASTQIDTGDPSQPGDVTAARRVCGPLQRGVNSNNMAEAAAACWGHDSCGGAASGLSAAGSHANHHDLSRSDPTVAIQNNRTHILSNNVHEFVTGNSKNSTTGTELSTGVVSEMLVTLGARRPPVDVILPDHCPLCRVAMVKGIGEQVLVCPTCHLTKTFLDSTAASMAFGEDSVEFNMFQYRRINHFNDALNELQGKEKATITDAQLGRIMEEMYNVFGAVSKDDITYAMVRHIIRDKLRMVKCYKHLVLITSLLSGRPALQMSPRHETLARLIFELMQEPFERAPFKERHNFLSYPVTLFKICQMLGLVEFFPMLPLLRGEDKLKQQEELFQWICQYRGWQAPPSVLSNPEAWM